MIKNARFSSVTKRFVKILAVLLVFFLVACAASAVGGVHIPINVIFNILGEKIGIYSLQAEAAEVCDLWWMLRVPRILTALLAGGALAVCGTVFQSIFRNPICDPYILGISSGASLGAAIAFVAGWNFCFFGVTLPALLGALLTLVFITGIACRGTRRSTSTLLLAGIAVNFFISALITLLMVMHQESMQQILFWTMGSLAESSWNGVAFLCGTIAVTSGGLLYFAGDLHLLQLGEESAKTLGVNAKRSIFWLLGLASCLTAVVVSLCGVIGFIGLVVPHILRLITGNDVRHLLPRSFFWGSLFLLAADTLARTVALPSELPVGSITALIGGPYFIFLLLKRK